MTIFERLASEFSLKLAQVESTVALVDEGNTIPFIARYRKEVTGSLDDQVLRELHERLLYLRNLEEQREKVRSAIDEQGKLTEEIETALNAAQTLTEIDDIYRPYRPKRRTRATMAKEKGLEPLALLIYEQADNADDIHSVAAGFVDAEKGVETAVDAVKGALDIIAEIVSDDADARKRLRYVCVNNGVLEVSAKKEELGVYEMYKEFSEQIKTIAGHRVLAVNRGEREDFLKVSVSFEKERGLSVVARAHVKNGAPYSELVSEAVNDSYDRLIFPSIEREIRNELTDKASDDAIKLFSLNLRNLLIQPPIKGKTVLGLDPGYRTGCKVAVVDATGKALDTAIIFPVEQFKRMDDAKRICLRLISKHGVNVIAIGNGTASHETEVFTANLIREHNLDVSYMVVSEAGASVYSASKLAAEEFPEYDVSLRSAVSIARRMQDPLAELVKIDPKAIGVGQYQHDMPQKQLTEALGGVVESCVNSVGVDLNTASAPLLSHIAGVSAAVAKNIVAFREENGAFTSRSQLKKVGKLGPKAFEQCAGFLRVSESKNILDNTAVHPESYNAAKKVLDICDFTLDDVKKGKVIKLAEIAVSKGMSKIAGEIGIGVPTLKDMVDELQKPGRDPRDELPPPLLRSDVMGLEDLYAGMELQGTVRNVIDFGAFVDIGVHQDGLVHISQISNSYIKHPSDALKVGDIVTVWVIEVDAKRERIALTMKKQ